MTKLFLDDVRKPYDSTWVTVRNYDEFVAYVKENGVPDVISFDHDLAIEHYLALEKQDKNPLFDEKTGYDCAKWLVYWCQYVVHKWPKIIIVHSFNRHGALRIANRFVEVGLDVRVVPYGMCAGLTEFHAINHANTQ